MSAISNKLKKIIENKIFDSDKDSVYIRFYIKNNNYNYKFSIDCIGIIDDNIVEITTTHNTEKQIVYIDLEDIAFFEILFTK